MKNIFLLLIKLGGSINIEAICDPEIDKLKNKNKILCQELNKADEAWISN